MTSDEIKAGIAAGSLQRGTVEREAQGLGTMPVVGAFLGFALGIYLVERIKLGTHTAAWGSTVHALKAIGLSMGIELLAGLAIATTWVIGVSATA